MQRAYGNERTGGQHCDTTTRSSNFLCDPHTTTARSPNRLTPLVSARIKKKRKKEERKQTTNDPISNTHTHQPTFQTPTVANATTSTSPPDQQSPKNQHKGSDTNQKRSTKRRRRQHEATSSNTTNGNNPIPTHPNTYSRRHNTTQNQSRRRALVMCTQVSGAATTHSQHGFDAHPAPVRSSCSLRHWHPARIRESQSQSHGSCESSGQ